jgi:hypothetical protein
MEQIPDSERFWQGWTTVQILPHRHSQSQHLCQRLLP